MLIFCKKNREHCKYLADGYMHVTRRSFGIFENRSCGAPTIRAAEVEILAHKRDVDASQKHEILGCDRICINIARIKEWRETINEITVEKNSKLKRYRDKFVKS